MTGVIYAIGDVHGRDDLLADLHESIIAHHAFAYPNRQGTLIYVGDYGDRGANTRGVIRRVRAGVSGFETVTLMGNHDAMLLECSGTDDPDAWSNWLQNGGLSTLASYGVSFGQGGNDPALLRAALGEDTVAWLEALLPYFKTERYLFVHAGIRPGVSLEQQDQHDLMWIRSQFLDSTVDHGQIVVHGHTPTEDVEILPNRIGIDTGVVHYGRLTAAVLTADAAPAFLYAVGEPGKGPPA